MQNSTEEVVGPDWFNQSDSFRHSSYFTLVDELSDLVFTIADDGKITFLNRAFERITGWDRIQWILRHFSEILHPEDAVKFAQKISSNEPFELRVLKSDGEYIDVEFCVQSGISHGRKIIGTGRDVSFRKKIQEQLSYEHVYARSIVDSSMDVIIATDKNRQIIEFNTAAENTFGYATTEVIGAPIDLLYADEMQCEEIFEDLERHGHSMREVLNKKKNGDLFISYLSASIIKDENGVRGYMGISRDITDKKKSEEKVQELASLLEIIPDGVIVADFYGHFLYWNKGASDLFKWSADEVKHYKINKLFGMNETSFQKVLHTVLKNDIWSGECSLKDKTGDLHTCLCRVTTVKGFDGIPSSFLFVATDITEKKMMDEQLSKHQRMESLGRLVSSITHDLNNIFTPIIISLDLLKLDVKEPNALDTIEKMRMYLKKGTKLIERVLSYSHGNIHTFQPEIVELHQLICDVFSLMNDSIPKSIVGEVLPDNKNLKVWGDPNLLFQVFMNLLVNALDAMPVGGAMKVIINESFARDCAWVCVSVTDSGMGITPENLDKIFEPFFTTKKKGTGIGLATVNAIVEQHGGFIEVESRVSVGSTFHIYLPEYRDAVASGAKTAADVTRQ
ncbi:PAS domain S-box protein [bacterium]|nr:PAS domain S-box protein [bacterium]